MVIELLTRNPTKWKQPIYQEVWLIIYSSAFCIWIYKVRNIQLCPKLILGWFMYKQVLQKNQAKGSCRKSVDFCGCSSHMVGGRRGWKIKGGIKASGVRCHVASRFSSQCSTYSTWLHHSREHNAIRQM